MEKPTEANKHESLENLSVGSETPRAVQRSTRHPLEEPRAVRVHRFRLSIFALCLLIVLSEAMPPSRSFRDALRCLFANRMLELLVGVIGVFLMLVDVVGTERLQSIDRVFLRAVGGQSNTLFLRGAFTRIAAYYRAYIGPGFWYERDLLFSWFALLFFVRFLDITDAFWLLLAKTTKPSRGDILWVTCVVLWVGMGLHTLCRFPRRLHNPRRVHWIIGHIGFGLMIASMLPWTILRLTFYFWCYLIYAPLDLIATVSSRLHLQGSLKIVGGALAITALIISHLRG